MQLQDCHFFSHVSSKGTIFFNYQVNLGVTQNLATSTLICEPRCSDIGEALRSAGTCQPHNYHHDCHPHAHPLTLVIGIHGAFQAIAL